MPAVRNLRTQRSQLQVVQAASRPKQKRRMRSPMHTFNLKSKPMEIVPFLIAPVIPGESFDNLMLQSTVVTDPLQNRLIGWWKEYHFFYVKHRSLSAWDTTGILQSMMLDASTSVASLQAGADSYPYYTFQGGMDYMLNAYKAILVEYFRDEGEAWDVATGETYPVAQISQESWIHSLKVESAGADDAELPGVDELEELDILPGFTTIYAQWEMMRDNGVTDLTYEDYLRSYGIDVPKSEDEGGAPDERHRPELIRSIRKWTGPSNVINPTDGAAKSAAYWKVAETANKRRFFKEPGFVIGVTITRPKIYLGNQLGSAVGMLDSAYAWLPAVLRDCPYVSVKEVLDSATVGILQNQTEDYWLDLKDLFLYGDQFVNYAPTAALTHGLSIPVAATAQHKYLTDAMVESLFVTAGSEYVYEDGVVHLNILSHMGGDTTP